MKNSQQGFTLIELVMVIVILGILAATAIPRFVNLAGDAANAALSGVQGALSSASAINYATRAARGAGDASVQNTTAGCTRAVADTLVDQLDVKYTISQNALGVVTNGANNATVDGLGDTWLCNVTDSTGDATPATVTWTLHWAN